MSIKNNSKKAVVGLVLGLGLATGLAKGTQPVQASSVNRPKTYTVKKGDCFWLIARKYKMSVRHLCAINGKHYDSIIMPKDKLKLKGKEQPIDVEASENGGVVGSETYYNTATPETSDCIQAVPQQAQPQPQQQAPASNQATYSVVSGGEASAKAWIAQRESGGSYNARNGRYIGKFQLDSAYLNGDHSPANQERVANNYVKNRYGSWTNAQAFWQTHGWY